MLNSHWTRRDFLTRGPLAVLAGAAVPVSKATQKVKGDLIKKKEVRSGSIYTRNRFTDRARLVMRLANKAAVRLDHESIGTEHVLLGLINEGSGVAVNVLKNLGIDDRKIQLEIEKIVQSGPNRLPKGKLPLTPQTKKLIEYSVEEARNLNHNYVGTEHLLLGMLRENDGVAGNVLWNLGVKLKDVRVAVLNLLGHGIGE